MSKKISGAEYPLAKIFSSDFDYAIPSYQRPYAWTEVQAGDLFSDLYDFFVKEKDDTYFLGSIVLIKDEGKPNAEVIDGQQRLTTLTILLAALTSYFSGDLRSDFENYLREPGRASQGLMPKPRLTLRERDRKFFADYVQNLKFKELIALDPAQLDNESQRNIRRNAELLLQKLDVSFKGATERLCEFGAFLVQRCFLVAVSTPSQQSAFRVFSVLNSRGLDLLPTDIIKSDIIGNIKSPDKQDDVTERWEELEVQTGRDGFAELFGHIRMIFAKEKARRTLLEEFREQVIKKYESPETLMSTVVEPFAEAYLIAKKCQYLSTTNAADVNALLKWLNRIDAFLGDGAATYDNGLLTIEHVLPQTVDPASDWQALWPDETLRKRWVHRLANLVPLTQKRNSKAQNYDFDTKKSAYFGGKHGVSSYVLTTQVLNAASWTPGIVAQRQTDLIDVLASRWDLK